MRLVLNRLLRLRMGDAAWPVLGISMVGSPLQTPMRGLVQRHVEAAVGRSFLPPELLEEVRWDQADMRAGCHPSLSWGVLRAEVKMDDGPISEQALGQAFLSPPAPEEKKAVLFLI